MSGQSENRTVSGKFLPGQSGNPGGRPRDVAEVRELARAHTADAIATLARIMTDPTQPPAAQVTAAVAMLDRGWGKANQPAQQNHGPTLLELIHQSVYEQSERAGQLVGSIFNQLRHAFGDVGDALRDDETELA